MDNKTKESVFQNDMISQFVANGWLLGTAEKYNRELAVYEEDLLGFVKETQDSEWQCGRARSHILAGVNPAPEGWPATG